jgi:hypothetical protein
VRAEFGVPEDRHLIQAVGLGFLGVDERPRQSVNSVSRRLLAEMVHRNGWSPEHGRSIVWSALWTTTSQLVSW